MPLTGGVPQGKKFFCPSCGALYSVTYRSGIKKETTIVKCVVCMRVMSETDSASVPVYTLIHRPEDA
jgi:transcription elongation factor Elf1